MIPMLEIHNPTLCGFPFSKSCNEDGEWQPHSTPDKGKKKDGEKIVFGKFS